MSNILDRGRTETEMRGDLIRADIARWYPGTHAHNAFSIMSPKDGHEVARCDRRQDRDEILKMTRSHDALVGALAGLLKAILVGQPKGASDDWLYDTLGSEVGSAVPVARAALKLVGRE